MFQIPLVRIRNPLQIVVAQWNNVTTELGLVQLEHQLAENSMLVSIYMYTYICIQYLIIQIISASIINYLSMMI